MKSRIIQSNYGLNHKQRQNIHHDVRADIGNKIINDLGMNMDAMILYTLLFTNKDITIEDLRQFHRYYVLNTKWLGRAFSMQEDPSYIARHFLEMNDIDLDKWLEEDEREWNNIENDTKDMTLDEFSKYMKVN